jgi:hypothetical protein
VGVDTRPSTKPLTPIGIPLNSAIQHLSPRLFGPYSNRSHRRLRRSVRSCPRLLHLEGMIARSSGYLIDDAAALEVSVALRRLALRLSGCSEQGSHDLAGVPMSRTSSRGSRGGKRVQRGRASSIEARTQEGEAIKEAQFIDEYVAKPCRAGLR